MNGLIYMADKTQQFQMRVSQEWLDAIDDWRTALRPVPSRAEAIRLLTEKGGLKTLESKKGKKR